MKPPPDRAAPHLTCPACRYDLSATAPDGSGLLRCPECGQTSTHDEALPPSSDVGSVADRTLRGTLSLFAGCAIALFGLLALGVLVAIIGGIVYTFVFGGP